MLKTKYKVVILAVIVFALGAIIGAGATILILLDKDNHSKLKYEIVKTSLPPAPPYPRDNLALKFPPASLPFPPATSTQSINTPKCRTQEAIKLSFPENTLDTSDWLTFRSESLGFEVKYPKDWEVVEHEYEKEFPTLGENGEILSLGSVSIWPKDDRESTQYDKAGTLIGVTKKSKEQIMCDRQKLQERILAGEVIESKGYEMYPIIEILETELWAANPPPPVYFMRTDTLYYSFFEKGNHLVFQKILLSFKLLK